MESLISKDDLEKVKAIKGEVIGATLIANAGFIVQKEGKKGLERLEQAMEEVVGYPLKTEELEPRKFYPSKLLAAMLLLMEKLFGFEKKEFVEIGREGPRIPLMLRVFIRYLTSVETLIKEAPEMWKRYFTIGGLEIIEYKEDERHITLQIKDFDFIPLQCWILKGYISSILEMVVRSSVSCEETKCLHRGDDFHEFVLRW